MAERSVQVIKNMLTKAKDSGQDPCLVMLKARNIPVDGLATPAQLNCSRALRSVLPYKQEKLEESTELWQTFKTIERPSHCWKSQHAG